MAGNDLGSEVAMYEDDEDNGREDGDDQINQQQQPIIARLESALMNMGLTPFSRNIAVEYIRRIFRTQRHDHFEHVIHYLIKLMNGAPRDASDAGSERANIRNWQYGCPEIIPGLLGKPIWYSYRENHQTDDPRLIWLHQLEESYPIIKAEFLKNRSNNSSLFQPYRSPTVTTGNAESTENIGVQATDRGAWNVCYLNLHGIDFESNIEQFPETMKIIKSIPRGYNHCFFSALAPNTHVTSHYGPTNKKLRVHLPLLVPSSAGNDACWLRVAEEKVFLQEGKCILFDDSFEHEAMNDDSTQPRVVLIIDIWHPDLSNDEMKFLDFINKAQMSAARRLSSQLKEDGSDGENFYSVIMQTRKAAIAIPEESIWGSRVIDD